VIAPYLDTSAIIYFTYGVPRTSGDVDITLDLGD